MEYYEYEFDSHKYRAIKSEERVGIYEHTKDLWENEHYKFFWIVSYKAFQNILYHAKNIKLATIDAAGDAPSLWERGYHNDKIAENISRVLEKDYPSDCLLRKALETDTK